jgi:hypothetical protein
MEMDREVAISYTISEDAAQDPCAAWVLSGLRQRIVQVQVGTVHGVGLGDPVLHARAGQDVVC